MQFLAVASGNMKGELVVLLKREYVVDSVNPNLLGVPLLICSCNSLKSIPITNILTKKHT